MVLLKHACATLSTVTSATYLRELASETIDTESCLVAAWKVASTVVCVGFAKAILRVVGGNFLYCSVVCYLMLNGVMVAQGSLKPIA